MFRTISVGGRAAASTLVVGQFKGQSLDKHTVSLDPDGTVVEAAGRAEATGEVGSISEAHPWEGSYQRVIVLGLGDQDSFSTRALRNAAGALGRRLAALGGGSVEINLEGPAKSARIKPADAGEAVGEGLGILAWTCDEFRGKATDTPKRPPLTVRGSSADFTRGLKAGVAMSEGTNLARTLSNTPPNICTPDYMAAQARKLARATGMTCTVIKGAQLEKEKLTGLINVGKASENGPCLIRLEYKPKGRSTAKPLVLVGKTMTYDSGGLSLKVNNGMKGMKRDKDGGCAVLGAMHIIATHLKPNRPVVALLAAAENSISDEAYRPDDIITFRNGVTVEVTNTDAEGRLVMADALCWACDKEKPGAIVDMATLTGGVVVALGKPYAGLWCDDDSLRGKLEAVGEKTGERVWRLPLGDEYRAMMRSPIADIHNSAPVREAHPIQGAAFLSYFVDKSIPWAHVDIAGTHAVDSDAGPFVAGPTGYGSRLLARLAEAL
ncbi:MAG: leucyl aminopeptidase family protein [Phycisphaerales bacterium JB037]